MKKLFALLLVAAMLVSLVSCSANNSNSKEAFDTSKEAFKETTQAYILVNEFSMDIYEAWRLGINEKSDYPTGLPTPFCSIPMFAVMFPQNMSAVRLMVS